MKSELCLKLEKEVKSQPLLVNLKAYFPQRSISLKSFSKGYITFSAILLSGKRCFKSVAGINFDFSDFLKKSITFSASSLYYGFISACE